MSVVAVFSEEEIFTEFSLAPGQFYFIGHDSGWIEKTVISNGVNPLLSIYIEPNDKATYWVRVLKEDTIDENYLFKIEFSINIIRIFENEISNILSTKFFAELKKSERNKPYTNKPYKAFDTSKPLEIYKYSFVNFRSFPFVKINNKTRSLIIAESNCTKELSKCIDIPGTYFLYNWEKFINLSKIWKNKNTSQKL